MMIETFKLRGGMRRSRSSNNGSSIFSVMISIVIVIVTLLALGVFSYNNN